MNYGKVFNWINTKFSAFVHHMSGLNWTKNFSHCSISGPVAPSSMPKLKTPLATIFVEKKFWKKIWWGSRPNWVTPWKEFVISWKKWRFEIFWTSQVSSYLSPLWSTLTVTHTSIWQGDALRPYFKLRSSNPKLQISSWRI